MKIRNFLILTIALSLCSGAMAAGKCALRVGSYNLWMTQIGKGDYAWEVRKGRLAQSVADCDFDVFGAQEVSTDCQRDLPELIRKAGGADYTWLVFSPYEADGGVGNKAQAIIYKTERFEVVERHHFWFSETPECMSVGWDEQRFKRGGLCATLRDRRSGVEFFVIHAHMPLGVEANLHAAEIVIAKAAQYNPKGLPAFFVGDLNTRPDTASSDLLREQWSDAFLTCKRVGGAPGTFNAAKTDRDVRVSRRIDYIYVCGSVKLKRYYSDAAKYDGFYPSDHFPLYVDAVVGR